MAIPAGTRLSREHIVLRRPGTGIAPAMLPYVLGRKARVAVAAGEVMTLEMLE
jgi:sialic acid synthase SpsE